MRSLPIILAISCAAATALADEAPSATIDLRTLPAPCRTTVAVPLDARTVRPTLAADVSAANCMAMINLHALKLSPTAASSAALAEALRPSIALLDAVIAQNDPAYQVIAQHAKADL